MVSPKNILVCVFIHLARLLFLVSLTYASSWKLLDEISDTCVGSSQPEACTNCLRADRSREGNEIQDFAYSIVFCLYSQATWAHELADQLHQNAVSDPALQVCRESLSSAANSFWDCTAMLEVSDYANAKIPLGRGQLYVYKCAFAGQKDTHTHMASSLRKDLDIIKRLHAVALYMLNCLIGQRGSDSIMQCDEFS